jgi:molybdenum cofactor cytidylyltransferase
MPDAPNIHGLLLAAGRSSRMGARNKLLEPLDGRPIVRIAAEAVIGSRCRALTVVTGHEEDKVRAALAGLEADFVHNPGFADGLAASLSAGLAAVPADADGIVVALGDMPLVTTAEIDRLIDAFAPTEGRAIVVPAFEGQRGNPVLWAARFLPELARLKGDRGGRQIMADHAAEVAEVAMPADAVLTDVDTPEALAALKNEAGHET